MAIYHLNVGHGSKATGRRAAKAAAGKGAPARGAGAKAAGSSGAGAKSDYLARSGDYASSRGGKDEVVLIESGNMPGEWSTSGRGRRGDACHQFWVEADKNERANGTVFKEVEFALPRELNHEQRIELAREFAEKMTNTKDGRLPYTLAVHAGKNDHNPHVHLMMSTRINDGIERTPETWFSRQAASPKGRKLDPAKGGAPKSAELRKATWLAETREHWAEVANAALDRAGHGPMSHIDHRSNVDRGLVQAPGQHIGPQAEGYEKRTEQRSDRGRRLDARDELRKTIAPGITTRTLSPRRDAPLVSLDIEFPVPAMVRSQSAEQVLAGALADIEQRQQVLQRNAIRSVGYAIPAHLAPAKPRPVVALVQPKAPAAIHLARSATAEQALTAALSAIHTRKQENNRVIDQRRTELVGELGAASRQLAAGNRQLREGRQQPESAERPTLQSDHLAQRREQAVVQLGGTGQPAGRPVLQRGSAVGRAFDRLDSAARRRTEVRELKAVDVVLIEQAEKRLEAAKPLAPSEPLTQPPAVAPAQPEKMLAERVAESLQAMLEWIKSVTGTLREAKPGGQYIGKISHADEHHAVQAQGHGFYTIHEQAKLAQRLDVGPAMVDIKYGKDGRGSVTVNERGGRSGR